MKSIIAFDLDGTLAESKQPIDEEISALLKGLLSVVTVVIMSAGDMACHEWIMRAASVTPRHDIGAA